MVVTNITQEEALWTCSVDVAIMDVLVVNLRLWIRVPSMCLCLVNTKACLLITILVALV